jgi:uncharacterized protein YkwD
VLLSAIAPVLAAARAVVTRRPHPCPGADLRPRPADTGLPEAATVCLLNGERRAHGLRPLRANGYLQAIAGEQVGGMVSWNYFADVRPSGSTPARLIKVSRYGARAAKLSTGENIGWGTGGEATPARMVAAWMHSPPHRAVILARGFRDVGVGIAAALPSALGRGSHGALYAVEFAARDR